MVENLFARRAHMLSILLFGKILIGEFCGDRLRSDAQPVPTFTPSPTFTTTIVKKNVPPRTIALR